MAMQAASLEILQRANVPTEQALAFVQVIGLEFDARIDALATRRDIDGVKVDIEGVKVDIDGVKQELEARIDGFRHDLELKIEGVKSELMRWVFTCITGQTAVLLGAAYFLTTLLEKALRP